MKKFEITVMNEKTLSRKQKEKILEIIGKKIPAEGITESSPMKVAIAELMEKAPKELLKKLKNITEKL